MSLIIPANSASAAGGYAVDNSCRFNSASNDHLNRTQTAGNRRKFTFSTWVKRCNPATRMALFLANRSGSNYDQFFLHEDGILEADFYHSGTQIFRYKTNALYRDSSAWYNIIMAVDTEHDTASSRVRIYVNGLEVTSFSTETNPSENVDTHVNENSIVAYIGSDYNSNEPDYYLAETVMLDGTQATPTDFGEFDADSGIWKPIDVSGLTFGTNGFYLDFKNSGALGADVSGNTNNFTVNNLTAIDQTTDTPTNNFATINPLFNDVLNIATMSDGNLTILSTSGYWSCSPASLAFSSGKWYYEVKWLTGTGGDYVGKVGWGNPDKGKFMETQGSILYRNSNGQKFIDNSGSAYGATWTTANDIIGVAIDVDGGTVTFYKNGSSQGDITISGGLDDGTFIIPYIQVANTDKVSVNFGNAPYAISSGNTDGNDRGNFEYAPPSGYLSLCTANLSEVLG